MTNPFQSPLKARAWRKTAVLAVGLETMVTVAVFAGAVATVLLSLGCQSKSNEGAPQAVAADDGFSMANRIAYREEMRANVNKIDLILSGVRAVEQAVKTDAPETGKSGLGEILRELNLGLLEAFPEKVSSRPGVMIYKASLKSKIAPEAAAPEPSVAAGSDCGWWKMNLVRGLPIGAAANALEAGTSVQESGVTYSFEVARCDDRWLPMLRLVKGEGELKVEFDNEAITKLLTSVAAAGAGKVPWKSGSTGSCTITETEGNAKVACRGIALPLSTLSLASIETLSIDLNGDVPLEAEVVLFEYGGASSVEPFRKQRFEVTIRNGDGVTLSSKPVESASVPPAQPGPSAPAAPSGAPPAPTASTGAAQ